MIDEKDIEDIEGDLEKLKDAIYDKMTDFILEIDGIKDTLSTLRGDLEHD